MNKKKYILLAIMVLGMAYFYAVYQYYSEPRLHKPYCTLSNKDDTVRIAYIGDSWAYLHEFHNCQIPHMLECQIHQPVRVYNFGISGMTSKDIYERIYKNSEMKSFFQKRYYSYSVVTVGVNDTDRKMGSNYYKRSMDGILQFLLANDIHPIILEIPNYDIVNSLKRQGHLRIFMRKISMYLNNTPIDCREQFRKVLDTLISENKYQNEVSIIRNQSWNDNFPEDLHHLYVKDGVHLNDKGYSKLDSIIVNEILRTY